ncbi:sigma-70 family RNA polymerase sigma factor [Streptomyces sp. A0642]|uniref:sigma-70 family RNA polymerase sigma factor n=1 Tax=Streptomyces sp. A0642 TaxID=2563100 RepID=UPI0010A28FB1|nr:sigma-70 family RNA polymerase sigma factor [Streptomyces sp. A0642]THA77634.1 sigma-70 family RNA polymerase sigma factor [Streptomyces sp. A0642]
MNDRTALAERFEADRSHLKAVAYRMLGSAAEAEDAVQESWLRAAEADVSEVRNLTGWLTTVVGRVCLNMLRSRRTRREDPLDAYDRTPGPGEGDDPEQEALLADSVGVALLVVLDKLAPAERLAFVLHDMFAVPFAEIGPLLDRSPDTARQLASRARRRVKGGGASPSGADPLRRRQVVEAFLSASRGGDFDALVALLHPDVVLHADRSVIPSPEPVMVRGAETVARGAMAATGRALFTGVALVDGAVALAMAPQGRLRVVLGFTLVDGLISGIDVVADPDRLDAFEIGVLDD